MADPDLNIWIKVTHVLSRSGCVKKVLSNPINLLYPDKEWCLTLGTGSLRWESEEDVLTQRYSRAMAGEGGLAAWMLLLWYAFCFFCLGLNLGGLIKVPLQRPPLALQAGGPHSPQGNSQVRQMDLEEVRGGEILVKMRIRQHQMWSWGVQVAFPRCLGGG